MAAATAPIKVDIATDELVSHAAHFMSRSKKTSSMLPYASTSMLTATRSTPGSRPRLASSMAPMRLLFI
jgi:hypothetical protein